MLYCVLGVPSIYFNYGLNLVYSIAATLHGEVQLIGINTPDQLKEAFAARKGRPVVLASDSLDARVMDVLVKAGAPIAIFVEAPEDAVGFSIESRNIDLRVAMQIYSQSASCLAPYVNLPSIRILHRPPNQTPFLNVLQDILDTLGLSLADEEWERLKVATLPAAEAVEVGFLEQLERFSPQALPMNRYRDKLPVDDVELIQDTLTPYYQLLYGRVTEFDWPIGMFRDSQQPDRFISGPIELLGPARHLMFGPNLFLPAGEWVATACFAVKENLSGNIIYVDVVVGYDIGSKGEFSLPSVGVFVFEIAFTVIDPRQPVSLRIVTKTGAIEGSLQLMWAKARPTAISG